MSNKNLSGIRPNQLNPAVTKPASLPPITRSSKSLEFAQDSSQLKKAISESSLQESTALKEKDTLVSDILAQQLDRKEKLQDKKLSVGPIEKADQARQDDAKKLDAIKPLIEKREINSPPEIDPELIRIFTSLHDQLHSSPVIFPKERKI